MKKLYEAWQHDNECVIAFGEAEGVRKEIEQGLISKDAKLLHQVETEYWEESANTSLFENKLGKV